MTHVAALSFNRVSALIMLVMLSVAPPIGGQEPPRTEIPCRLFGGCLVCEGKAPGGEHCELIMCDGQRLEQVCTP